MASDDEEGATPEPQRGLSPKKLIVFIGAPLLMLTIAAAAAFVPTRRAVRVNPMSVLRSE